MRAEVVSLEPGEEPGLFKAVLKMTDERLRDIELVRKALERSVNSLNALEMVRENAEALEARALILHREILNRAAKTG